MRTIPISRDSRGLLIATVMATMLAAALRIYGITGQVLLDDEWHAVHKLISSSYENIFKSFGVADHSIPLTLLYKAMANAVGLAEGRMRALQIAFGIATVPVGAWIAWRATRDAPAAALFAILVAGAPFLVMWSRFARPYAMTPLLAMLCVAAMWSWRSRRTRAMGACFAIATALLVWFHPLCGVFPAVAGLFVFFEDVAAPGDVRPRPAWSSIKLGMATAATTGLLLAAPALQDFRSLTAKAGGDQPGFDTFERMLAILWGGLPTPVWVLACAVALWGLVAVRRREPRLGTYLALLAVVPPATVTLLGAQYAHAGQNMGRYVLPVQLIVLFLGSVGAVSLVRAMARERAEGAAWIAMAILSSAYLLATPTVRQVATLGPWYAHLDYHWDYRYRWMVYKRGDPASEPPAFYLKLGRMAAGSAPIIEAPFVWEAPYNPLAWYANYHRQPETFGMLHDLCPAGDRIGEVPSRDRRFRFRRFVFLDDVDSVRQTGARYLLLIRDLPHRRQFPQKHHCIDKLTSLYGAPIEMDSRIAVWDLKPGDPPPKLQ